MSSYVYNRSLFAVFTKDTAIQKLQNLQRNVWISGQVSGNPYICYLLFCKAQCALSEYMGLVLLIP